MRNLPASVQIPLARAFMSAIAVFGQTIAWAYETCTQPNPAMKNCVNPPPNVVPTCNGLNNPPCVTSILIQINQFPNGAITATSGTTTQQVANCYRTQSCVWNATTMTCLSLGNWNPWVNANKTVVGTDPCPVNEG